MSSSKVSDYSFIEECPNGTYAWQYFTPLLMKNAKLIDIVQDKKEFIKHSVLHFYTQNLDEKKLGEYFSSILKIINLTKKNLTKIKKQWLISEVKIETIEYSLDEGNAIIIFADGTGIVFKPYPLDSEEVINRVILELNLKVWYGHELFAKKILNCGKYGFTDFIKTSECVNDKELHSYYFKSGELLSILYVLNFMDFGSYKIIDNKEYPILESSEIVFARSKDLNYSLSSVEIASYILKHSVYNIEFLPKSKDKLKQAYMEEIKSGFECMYNILISTKSKIICILKDILDENEYLVKVIAKMSGLNHGDLQRQLYYIDVRFNNIQLSDTSIKFSNEEKFHSLDRNVLKQACKLGDYIIQKGIIGYKYPVTSRTWIAVVADGRFHKNLNLSPTEYNLYDGNSGIALFFLYLGVVSQKQYFINIAVEAMQDSIEHIKSLNKKSTLLTGAFKGISSEIYTLSKIYKITKIAYVKEAIVKGISFLSRLIKKDICIDVVEGAAGVIGVLMSMYNDIDFQDIKNEMMKLANLAYKNIVSNIEVGNTDVSFGYGIDGVIGFLAKFMKITDNKKIEGTIIKLLAISRKNCSVEKEDSGEGWARGYPSILISRLMLKEYGFNDNLIDTEILEAVNYTIINGFSNSSYYAEGKIGNLEILDYASEVLKDSSLKIRCTNTFNKLVKDIIIPDINKEIKDGNRQLSLMDGVVGLGYSLIRMSHKDLVPQVLWLQ